VAVAKACAREEEHARLPKLPPAVTSMAMVGPGAPTMAMLAGNMATTSASSEWSSVQSVSTVERATRCESGCADLGWRQQP